MFIALEGPDNVGKTTSAMRLSGGAHHYNATKKMHEEHRQLVALDHDIAYDRIDWLSHMVYRLALPDRDWNDDRPRTVFAMPDTHLVIKLHRPDLAEFTAEEVVDTPIGQVNPMYWWFAEWMVALNEIREFALFRTISIMEVANEEYGYTQELKVFSTPVPVPFEQSLEVVNSDESLVALLRHVESQL